MQIAKWGNSLAVRIPADVARQLGVKEGDSVDLRAAPGGGLELAADAEWQEALSAINKLARAFPPGYRFDREEANAR